MRPVISLTRLRQGHVVSGHRLGPGIAGARVSFAATTTADVAPDMGGCLPRDSDDVWRCSHDHRFMRPEVNYPSVLRHRDFRRFFIGQSASMMGDQFSAVAIPLTAILLLDGGPRDLGLLTAIGLLPSLLLSLPAGSLIDRKGHRRVWMLVADAARATAILTVPLAYFLGSLSLGHLYVVALVVGAFDVVFFVAYQPLLVAMVRGRDYLAASTLLNGSRAISQVVGLSAGGTLVAVLTAPVALLVNAGSFVLSGVQLARIRPDEPPPAGSGGPRLRGGLQWILRSQVVKWLLFSSAIVNLFAYMGTAVLILYATRTLSLGPTAIGVVFGLGSIGGVIGAATTRRMEARLGLGVSAVIGPLTFAAGLMVYPAASGGPLTAAAVLLVGALLSTAGIVWADISLGAVLAQEVPDVLRARVAGAYRTVNYGVRPLGAAMGGFAGAALDLRITLLLSALGAVLGASLRIRRPIWRLVLADGGDPAHTPHTVAGQ